MQPGIQQIQALLWGKMERAGWNRSRLAEALDVSPSVITRWLMLRDPVVPSPKHCEAIAAIVGLPVFDILQLAGHVAEDDQFTNDDYDRADVEWERFSYVLREVFGELPRDRWHTTLAAIHQMIGAILGAENPPVANNPNYSAAKPSPGDPPAALMTWQNARHSGHSANYSLLFANKVFACIHRTLCCTLPCELYPN